VDQAWPLAASLRNVRRSPPRNLVLVSIQPVRQASIRTLCRLLPRLVHVEIRQSWSCYLACALEELTDLRSDLDWAVVREGSSRRDDLEALSSGFEA
jgi:hypothetical protein